MQLPTNDSAVIAMNDNVCGLHKYKNKYLLTVVCLEYCIPTLFIRTNDAVLYFTKLNSV